MIDALDLEAIHRALDLNPSDQVTRRVLADWYEDDGDMVMASGLRWMAARGKRPRFFGKEWDWSLSGHHHGVGIALIVALSGMGTSPCRRAAEETLCRALAARGVTS